MELILVWIFKERKLGKFNEKSERIIRDLRDKIFSKTFKILNRKSERDFTRTRKLGFVGIILFQISTASKTLSVELSKYLTSKKISATEYSKQAYSKGRMKIKHTCYIELNDSLLEEYYKSEDYKSYKDYRLLGIDGSEIELQHGASIYKEFGRVFTNRESINASKSVVIYDLLNELVIDSELNIYNSSERASALKQFKRMQTEGKSRKDIIVADRGFPSLEVFSELLSMGYDFVIRYSGHNFLRETLALVESKENDLEIEISLKSFYQRKRSPRIKELLSKGYPDKIKLRVVKLTLSNGVKEYLITSILDKNEFTIEDFNEIYNLRWNEEVYFDFQKNIMEIENFTGKSVETIKQDYYCTILVGNLHSLIIADAQEEVDKETKKNKKLKHQKYKINKSVTFGIMKEQIYDLLTAKRWKKQFSLLVKEAKKYKIPVIKNRSFPREKKGNLKYPITRKRAM